MVRGIVRLKGLPLALLEITCSGLEAGSSIAATAVSRARRGVFITVNGQRTRKLLYTCAVPNRVSVVALERDVENRFIDFVELDIFSVDLLNRVEHYEAYLACSDVLNDALLERL